MSFYPVLQSSKANRIAKRLSTAYTQASLEKPLPAPPVKRQTEHVELAKYSDPVESTTVEDAFKCCKQLIGLTLTRSSSTYSQKGITMEPNNLRRNINITIACLCINLPSTMPVNLEAIKPTQFDDECDCISTLLDIKDKLIYLVVPLTYSDFVVPALHNHSCVESVYIYFDDNTDGPLDWMEDYAKIRLKTDDLTKVLKEVDKDINSIMHRPSRWSRSKTLLAQLCLQMTDASSSTLPDHEHPKGLDTLRIGVLHLVQPRLFHVTHERVRIDQFDSIEQCIRSIGESSTAFFLIISMNRAVDIRAIVDLKNVHAVYIVGNFESEQKIQLSSTYSKLSGIFNLDVDLLDQLITDICFHRHIQIHTPTVSVLNIKPNILEKPNEHDIEFLCFQLFSTILPQIPLTESNVSASQAHSRHLKLSNLIDANMKITNLLEQFNLSTLKDSVVELSRINQHILSLPKAVSSSAQTIYRAQVIESNDWETIRNHSNALLAIQTFVTASRSFQSIVDICRQAADNQLNVVLFEIKLSDNATIAELDANTIIFNLGTVFRLVSTELEVTGIRRAQLELTEGTMARVNDQLRLEVGTPLTWLTFGNYLTALKRFDAAKNYYEYLLLVLPLEHPSRISIYNNIGLMHLEMDDNKTALEAFKKALKAPLAPPSMTTESSILPFQGPIPRPTFSDKYIELLDNIAETSYRTGDKKQAIECYRRAFNMAADAASRQYFETKINEIKSLHNA